MKAKIIVSISLLLITISTYSQWIPENLTSPPILPKNDSNTLTINVEVAGYFLNK